MDAIELIVTEQMVRNAKDLVARRTRAAVQAMKELRLAKDALHDEEVALLRLRDAFVARAVRSEAHLRDGWDGMCLPYGGDGNTRIKDLLAHNANHSSGDQRESAGMIGSAPERRERTATWTT